MNICITPASIKNFGAYFKREIPSVFTNQKSSKALLTELFNKALSDFGDTPRNRELMLQHLSIAPQVLLQHIGNNPSAAGSIALPDLQKLAGTIVTSTEDKTNESFQNVLKALASTIGSKKIVISEPAEIRFDAVGTQYAKTFNQEVTWSEKDGYKGNALDPKKAFEFAVQKELLRSQNEHGFSFKLLLKGDAAAIPNIGDVNTINNEEVFMILVDSKGKPVTFNQAGTYVKDGSGKIPVYQVRSAREDFNVKVNRNASVIQQREGISFEEASIKSKLELDNYIKFIQNAIASVKAGKVVTFDIDMLNSSDGLVEINAHNKTGVSLITNIGTGKDDAVFYIEQRGKQTLPLIKPAGSNTPTSVFGKTLNQVITDEELNLLHQILTKSLTNKGVPLTKTTWLELIGYYVNPGLGFGKPGGLKFIVDFESKTIQLNEELIHLPDLTLDQLSTFLNSKRGVLYNGGVPLNITPFKSASETTEDDQFYYNERGGLMINRMPVRNFGITRYKNSQDSKIKKPLSITNNEITIGEDTVGGLIMKYGSTQAQLSSEGRLQAFGSSIAFKPSIETITEEPSSDMEEVFFRSLAEINSSQHATQREESIADNWFKNSPLSKVLRLTAFNQIHEKGPSYIAEFVNGAINLYLGSDKTDIYHESFHAFTQAILSKEERDVLYNELRKAPGSFQTIIHGVKKSVAFSTASDLEIEEYLAEEFRKFARSKGMYSNKLSSRIAQFFDKLLNMLHGIFGKNMTYNEARTLNKVQGVVNTMFNNLYEGNIDISKFNPAMNSEALYRSNELTLPEDTFSLGEMKVAMESMQSIFADFVKLGLNSSTTIAEQQDAVKTLLHLSKIGEDSPEHKALSAKVEQLEKSKTLSGYGVFQIQKSSALLIYAARYMENRLKQQLSLFPKDGSPTNEFNHNLLTKIINNFGTAVDGGKYIDAEVHENLLSLFLNNYSGINLTSLKSDNEYDEPSAEDAMAYGLEGTEKSLIENTDGQTKQLLSSIAAYSKQGKGEVQVNIIGVKKLVPVSNMIAKVARLLRNTPDAVDMYNSIKTAAKTDKEFQQLLQLLGDITNEKTTSEENDQWSAFWQVFNKPDVFLRQFILEKNTTKDGEISYTAKSGKTSSQSGVVKRDWADGFIYQTEQSDFEVKHEEGQAAKLNVSDIAESFMDADTLVYGLLSGYGAPYIHNKTEARNNPGSVYNTQRSNLASADPIAFLKEFGIELADDPLVRRALIYGDESIDFGSHIYALLLESLQNRITAVNESDKYVSDLNDLFGKSFRYTDADGKIKTQASMSGAFTKLQELHYTYSNDFTNFTARNAEGELQSEKPFNSSLTLAVTTINNSNSYEDLIGTPGMEFLDHESNPFAVASNWIVEMFQLNHSNPKVRGKRIPGMKLVIENLSGSQISNVVAGEGSETKGVSSMKSDERTKFITDFHLTLEGKQEILRSADKSTSLTVYLSYQVKDGEARKGRNLIVNGEEVESMLGKNYTGKILYDQFKGQIEAELVRISRIEKIKKGILSEDPAYDGFVFDVAYLNRGSEFQMFDEIFSESLKAKLLKLGVSESLTFDKASKKLQVEIETALLDFFKNESDLLYTEKDKLLTVADDLFKEYSKGEENETETAEDVRKKMFLAFTINSFLQYGNYASLFLGDSAIHNVAGEDYHKRIPGFISTGKIFRHDDSHLNYINSDAYNHNAFSKKHVAESGGTRTNFHYSGYLETAVLKEKVTSSVYAKKYAEQLGIDVSEYTKMKEADGAGWISFDAYRTLNKSCNEWSPQQESLYQKMLNGETLTKADMKATFPVRKFQYKGPVSHSNTIDAGLSPMAFHKYSLMPLIPALIKDTPLEKVHNQMMEQGVDYVTMQSGSKVSSLSKVKKVTDANGVSSIVADFDDVYDNKTCKVNDITFTKNTLHVKYLKSQIFIKEGFKGKITLPTQLRKIAMLGFYDNGVPKDFKGTVKQWNALTDENKKEEKSANYKWFKEYSAVISDIQVHLKQELLEDIGLDIDLNTGAYSGDSKKLVAYLKEQLSTGELLPEEIAMISDADGNMIEDLSLSLQSAKLEQILVTLVDKKLRRLKFNGEALVQIANTMFHENGANFSNPTEADIAKYGSNGLKFYEKIDSETGESYISSMEVKIALQGDFLHLLKLKHPDNKLIEVRTADGKVDIEASRLRLNEAIKNETWNVTNKKFLQFAGVRIPTQGPNSLDVCQVAEFLPTYAGGIVILPAEVVAKSGSDYDIDKMFFLFKNIVNIGGTIEEQSYSYKRGDKKNLLVESKLLQVKNDEVQEKIKAVKKAKLDSSEKVKDVISNTDVDLAEPHFAIHQAETEFAELVEIGSAVYKKEGVYANYNLNRQMAKHAELKAQREVLKDEIAANQLIVDEAYKKALETSLSEEELAKLNSYDAEIESLIEEAKVIRKQDVEIQRSLSGTSVKGLENKLHDLFIQKILNVNTFDELVTANTTDAILPTAKVLERAMKKEYSKYTGSESSSITNTTIFKYRYNLLKHQENSVGIESLGIAAIASTFYAVFNTYGAELNGLSESEKKRFDAATAVVANPMKQSPESIKKAMKIIDGFKSHTLKIKHNFASDKLGQRISLGFANNVSGKSISDLLSQLINGYVDVAKDAWIFNIQGNKQNTPTLLFMVMAGVDINTAIFLSANPLVVEYNAIKKEMEGVFSNLSTDETSPVVNLGKGKIEAAAKLEIFKRYEGVFFENKKAFSDKSNVISMGITDDFNEGDADKIKEILNSSDSISSKIKSLSSEHELFSLITAPKITWRHMEALAHYMDVESFANDLNRFTQLTKFDTTKVETISDAQKRINDTENFKNDNTSVPDSWFDDIAKTPIGLFNNDKFTVDLFSRYFGLRNSPALTAYALALKVPAAIKGTDPGTYRTDYKNDFLLFLYQNSRFKEGLYGGLELIKDKDVNTPLKIENGVVSYGENILENARNKGELVANGLDYFFKDANSQLSYVRYLIEYEKIQEEGLTDEEFFKKYAQFRLGNKEIRGSVAKKIALYRSDNITAMFDVSTSYASVFKKIKAMYPELSKYALIEDMRFDYDNKNGTGNRKHNMWLAQIKEIDLALVYKENLQELKNFKDSEVAEFFKKFEHMAILQTGMNRRSKFDLAKLVDQSLFERTIKEGIGMEKIQDVLDDISEKLSNKITLDSIKDDEIHFVNQYDQLFDEMSNNAYRTRVKGYSYEVNHFNDERVKKLNDTAIGTSNVVIVSKEEQVPEGEMTLLDMLYEDTDETSPKEAAEGLKEVGKKVYIVNKKMTAPKGFSQDELDAILMDSFGIDNKGNLPKLVYISKQEEGMLTLVGAKRKKLHGIKDDAMASASTKAIGQPTIANTKYSSSSKNYVEYLEQSQPGALATNTTKFKPTDSVWVFGSGTGKSFENAYSNTTAEKFEAAVADTFKNYHKKMIDKAVKANVSKFNIGTAEGIDKMAVKYLLSLGYVKNTVYAPIGKYFELAKDAEYKYPVNVSELGLSKLIKELQLEKSKFDSLSESDMYTKGKEVVKQIVINTIKRLDSVSHRELTVGYSAHVKSALRNSEGYNLEVNDSIFGTYVEQSLTELRDAILTSDNRKKIEISQEQTATVVVKFDELSEFTAEERKKIIVNFADKYKTSEEAALENINKGLANDRGNAVKLLKELLNCK